MNTTDNERDTDTAKTLKTDVTKEDAKKMKDEYVKGASIDSLADQYGYDSKEVEAAVVTEVPEGDELPTQESEDKQATKKAK